MLIATTPWYLWPMWGTIFGALITVGCNFYKQKKDDKRSFKRIVGTHIKNFSVILYEIRSVVWFGDREAYGKSSRWQEFHAIIEDLDYDIQFHKMDRFGSFVILDEMLTQMRKLHNEVCLAYQHIVSKNHTKEDAQKLTNLDGLNEIIQKWNVIKRF